MHSKHERAKRIFKAGSHHAGERDMCNREVWGWGVGHTPSPGWFDLG